MNRPPAKPILVLRESAEYPYGCFHHEKEGCNAAAQRERSSHQRDVAASAHWDPGRSHVMPTSTASCARCSRSTSTPSRTSEKQSDVEYQACCGRTQNMWIL